MTNLEERIRTVLRIEADAMRVPHATPSDHVARGMQMPEPRRRARIAIAMAAATLIVAAGFVVLAQRRDSPEETNMTDNTGSQSSPSTTPKLTTTPEPVRCVVPDGTTTANGPVTVAVNADAIPQPVPAVDTSLSLRATVTNISDAPIRIHGQGQELLWAFLTAPDGTIVSAEPPLSTAALAVPTLQPGESLDWPVLLWLEQCGMPRGTPLEPGAYELHVWLRVADPNREDSGQQLLSMEAFPIEIAAS